METVVYTLFAIGGVCGIYAMKLAVDMLFEDIEQELRRWK